MISTIAARRLIGPGGIVEHPLLTVEDGRISRIESLTPLKHQRISATHHFPEATLVPAYVDIHIHGCAGHDVMEATPKALHTIGAYLANPRRRSLLPYPPSPLPKTPPSAPSPGSPLRSKNTPTPPTALPPLSASTSKARSSPISSAASTPTPSSKLPPSPSSTASGRPPRAKSSS